MISSLNTLGSSKDGLEIEKLKCLRMDDDTTERKRSGSDPQGAMHMLKYDVPHIDFPTQEYVIQ